MSAVCASCRMPQSRWETIVCTSHRGHHTFDPPRGPFSLEDVADGVPGAAEWMATQATKPKREPLEIRDPRKPDIDRGEWTAKEWDESLDSPDPIKVEIPGIAASGRDYWVARPVQISNPDGSEYTIYRIEGDPNAVAVGRFKASLRKFLGIA
jgi:hypothetical protein